MNMGSIQVHTLGTLTPIRYYAGLVSSLPNFLDSLAKTSSVDTAFKQFAKKEGYRFSETNLASHEIFKSMAMLYFNSMVACGFLSVEGYEPSDNNDQLILAGQLNIDHLKGRMFTINDPVFEIQYLLNHISVMRPDVARTLSTKRADIDEMFNANATIH